MDDFERAARRELVSTHRLGFRIHAAVYVAVQLLLVVTWALTSYEDGGFGFPWFLFPLIGWGIGLAAHYAVYSSQRKSRDEPAGGPGTGRATAG